MEDYLSIIRSLGQKPEQPKIKHTLVIDGLNMFIRCFSVITVVNPQGNSIGGLTGFLRSLNTLKRQFNPDRIIIAWDGKGGALNRKHLNPNYKSQRERAAVIHWDMYDTKEEEIESMHDQIDRLKDYLDCLPITFISLDKLEADDIVAYIANTYGKAEEHITIVSSDKDFLQLVSQHVDVYNPVKKVLYDYSVAQQFLGVLPENYNIVKALVGDASDNLMGIKGAGVKTLVKLYPRLLTDTEYSLQNLYDESAANLGVKKLYARILSEWNLLETNFIIMDLHETVLDEVERDYVDHKVQEHRPKLQIGKFMFMLEQDQIETIAKDMESWLLGFSDLE